MKQFKRMILASTLMVGLAGFAVSCKYGDDIDEIRKDIESLRTGQVASVESQLSSLQATVSNLSSASDAIKGSVSSLESKVNSLQSSSAAEIDALKSAVQKLQGQLSSLESSAATKTEVENLQKKLNDLSSALDGVKDDLSKFEGKTDKKFEEIDDELVTINSEIKTINDQLAAILAELKTFATAEDLQNLVGEVEKVNAALQANIQALQEAVAEIEKLKKADELLQTQIDDLKKSLENYVTNDQFEATLKAYATIKEVAEAIAEVTKALGQFTTEEAIQKAINDAIEAAVNAAGEPFKTAFQTAFDAAVVAAGLVDNEELNARIAAFDDKIAAAIAQALENEGVINEEIATQIGAAVADLQKFISGRLTSVVLIPELYVGGIEAIGLKSFKYTEKVVTSTDKKEEYTIVTDKTTKSEIYYSAGAFPTDVRYHVSPAHLTKADIMKPEFVYESAQTRTAVKDNLLNVRDWDVKDGELIVTVNKASGAMISDGEGGIINTAAIRVPIAEKNLAEGETNAVVYSDYARLDETTVEPQIAALIDHSDNAKNKENDGEYECSVFDEKTKKYIFVEHYHFYPNYAAFNGEGNYVSQEVLYNTSYDLLEMVTGCWQDKDGVSYEITKDELKDYGFEFRFALPTMPYTRGNNNTDQQKFAKLNNSVISSSLPNGVADNKAAVGKTPIVRVELIDTNNGDKVVDVRYFMIKWVDKLIVDTFEESFSFNYTLSCENFTGTISWTEFVTKVLANVTEGGMSYNEFVAYYDLAKATIASKDHVLAGDGEDKNEVNIVAKTADNKFELNIVEDEDAYDQKSARVVWTLNPGQIGKIMNIDGTQTVTEKNVTVTIPTKSTAGAITLHLKVNIKKPVLPAFNGTQSTFWEKPGEVANVYPIIYKSPINGSVAGDAGDYQYVKYEYDFSRLFADFQLVKNMLPCSKWDVQFAHTQTAIGNYDNAVYMYEGASTEPAFEENDGYYLFGIKDYNYTGDDAEIAGPALDPGVAAYFEFNATMGSRWYPAENEVLDAKGKVDANAVHKSIVSDITLKVSEEDGNPKVGTEWGKSILTMSNERGKYDNDKLFDVKIWVKVNDFNPYLVKTFKVRFIAPFYVNTKSGGKFTDMVVSGSPVEVSTLLTMTDFNGYTVGKTDGKTEKTQYATKLWDYYVVDDPVWDLSKAMTNLAKVGDNYEADPSITEGENATISAESRFGEGALDFPKKADGTYDYTKIVFKNVSGVPIESEVQIFIPVTVTHKWGTFTQYVSATLQPRQ